MTDTTFSSARPLNGFTAFAIAMMIALASLSMGSSAGAEQQSNQYDRAGQVTLYTNDMDAMIDFYVDQLGFELLYQFPDENFTFFATLLKDDMYLTLATYDAIRESTGLWRVRPSFFKSFELVMLASNSTQVHDWVAEMEANGVTVAMQPVQQPWGETSAYVLDPERNLIQISTHNEG